MNIGLRTQKRVVIKMLCSRIIFEKRTGNPKGIYRKKSKKMKMSKVQTPKGLYTTQCADLELFIFFNLLSGSMHIGTIILTESRCVCPFKSEPLRCSNWVDKTVNILVQNPNKNIVGTSFRPSVSPAGWGSIEVCSIRRCPYCPRLLVAVDRSLAAAKPLFRHASVIRSELLMVCAYTNRNSFM